MENRGQDCVEINKPCGLGEGIAVDVLAQVTEKMREGSAIKTKG